MTFAELNDKLKDNIPNLVIIIIAIIISTNTYKKQLKEIQLLREKKEIEIKKNIILEDINLLEKKINFYKSLFVRKDASIIMSTINDIAKEAGIKIISFRPLQEQRFEDYVKIPFDLMIIAPNYHALGKFISKVESYNDIYIVDLVSLKFEEETEELSVGLMISSVVFSD